MKKNSMAVISSIIIITFTLTSCTAKYVKEEQQLGVKVSDLQNQLAAEKSKVAGLQKQVDDLNKQLNAEKAKNTGKEKQVSDLKLQLDTEKTKETGLQKQLDSLNKKNTVLDSELQKEIKNNEDTYNRLVANLKDEIQKDEITINKYKNALTINIAERILFDLGRAEIKSQYYPVLNKIGKIIKDLPDKFIQIEGHTDDVPIAEGYQWKIPNNWALGARRAINVTIYFIDHFNMDPHRIAVMSFSKYRPIVPNTTAANRAKNRRIEIVILNKQLYQEMEKKQGL